MKHVKKVKHSVIAAAVLAAAGLAAPERAAAQTLVLGDILQVAFDFCPRSTLSAEGQLLPINQNQALYSLYGTFYGGDGINSFALPDMRGRYPMSPGQGTGLSLRQQGQKGGADTQTLTQGQMPSHSHAVNANNLDGDKAGPGGKILAAAPPGGSGSETIYSDQPPNVTMSPAMIGATGGNLSFNIQDPFLVMRYCVVTQGIFPSRS